MLVLLVLRRRFQGMNPSSVCIQSNTIMQEESETKRNGNAASEPVSQNNAEQSTKNVDFFLRPKKVLTCYLFCVFLGAFGVHKVYLGKPGSAGVYTILFLLGLCIPAGILLMILGFLLLGDLVLIPAQVRCYNEELSQRIQHHPHNS
jgi:TM2 domain-containing membrane protein YozV